MKLCSTYLVPTSRGLLTSIDFAGELVISSPFYIFVRRFPLLNCYVFLLFADAMCTGKTLTVGILKKIPTGMTFGK